MKNDKQAKDIKSKNPKILRTDEVKKSTGKIF